MVDFYASMQIQQGRFHLLQAKAGNCAIGVKNGQFWLQKDAVIQQRQAYRVFSLSVHGCGLFKKASCQLFAHQSSKYYGFIAKKGTSDQSSQFTNQIGYLIANGDVFIIKQRINQFLHTILLLDFVIDQIILAIEQRFFDCAIQNYTGDIDNYQLLSLEDNQFKLKRMQKIQDEPGEIIENKIMKVNGQIGFKRYQRGKLLGKGGFAKCYEGLNLETKKYCAIKVIDKVSLQKNRAKQKLLSQIKIHKTLHHQYIVEFDSVFEDSNYVYIILELCVNKTLSEMVKKRKRLTAKQTRYFMLQLISAVDYMHGNRVIHRDLKLGNIFLNAEMDLKVGDFGLAAKLQFSEEKKRTMCGTPNYIAPQIVEGSVGHSYEVDIWSMGVICFAFLFGRPPFQTNQVKLTYKKIKSCEYTFPTTNAPEQGKDFIKNILILDPKKRLTTKEMLAHPFLKNEDIPKSLSVQAQIQVDHRLTQIPSFKSEEEGLVRVKSTDRLRPQDFGKKKLELNLNLKDGNEAPDKIYEGMHSPRSAFNYQQNPMKNHQSNETKDEHRINILAYLDYSKKYGLGYVLNSKYYGVYFNDETLMSCDSSKQNIYFVQNPTLKQETIQAYKPDTMPKDRDFQKKYMLLERFVIHLNEELDGMPAEKLQFQKDDNFIFIKQWLKTRHAIMFGLSNKLFQVNFFDNSQILLHTAKKTVLFTSKKGEKTYEVLSNVLQTQENEMARRIKYTKQILNSIKRKKDEKIDEIPMAADR